MLSKIPKKAGWKPRSEPSGPPPKRRRHPDPSPGTGAWAAPFALLLYDAGTGDFVMFMAAARFLECTLGAVVYCEETLYCPSQRCAADERAEAWFQAACVLSRLRSCCRAVFRHGLSSLDERHCLPDEDGPRCSALLNSIRQGQLRTARKFIAAGACIQGTSPMQCALWPATTTGNRGAIELLLDCQADVNHICHADMGGAASAGRTPLDWAIT